MLPSYRQDNVFQKKYWKLRPSLQGHISINCPYKSVLNVAKGYLSTLLPLLNISPNIV